MRNRCLHPALESHLGAQVGISLPRQGRCVFLHNLCSTGTTAVHATVLSADFGFGLLMDRTRRCLAALKKVSETLKLFIHCVKIYSEGLIFKVDYL